MFKLRNFLVKRRKPQLLSLKQKLKIIQLRELPENKKLSIRKYAEKLSKKHFDRTIHKDVVFRCLRDKEKFLKSSSSSSSLKVSNKVWNK